MSHSVVQKTLFTVVAVCGTLPTVWGQTPSIPAGSPQITAFVAEGVVPLTSVLSAGVPNFAPDTLAQLQAGTLQARQRVTYNAARNVLTVWIFTANPTSPLPSTTLPSALPPTTISLFEIAPEVILQSNSPSPNLLFAGRVISNTVPSPFGSLNGATAAYTIGYNPATAGMFTLAGGTVGGSHATFSSAAQGTLTIGGGTTTPPVDPGTPGNRPPVADIGPVSSVFTTVPVFGLDASRSTDPDGDPLTFQWKSIGRQASISNANTAQAQVQFGGEVGDFVFEVTVSDNKGNSSTARMTVTFLGR